MDWFKDIDQRKSIGIKRPGFSQRMWDDASQYFKTNNFLYFCSSGTNSNKAKIFEVSHSAMIDHAKRINHYYGIAKDDKWLVSLPLFYMGGISIVYRSYALGSEMIITENHKIENIIDIVNERNIQYFSLVPYQLKRFVQKQIKLPSCVKKVFIGGDFIDLKILSQIDPRFVYCYGLSETCSQIAYYDRQKNIFECYPWNTVTESDDETLLIKTPFKVNRILLCENEQVTIHNIDEIKTEDRIDIVDNRHFHLLGRKDRKIKYKGIFLDLDELEQDYLKQFPNHQLIITYGLDQFGQVPWVLHLGSIQKSFFKSYKISNFKEIKSFKFTDSGKVLRKLSEY